MCGGYAEDRLVQVRQQWHRQRQQWSWGQLGPHCTLASILPPTALLTLPPLPVCPNRHAWILQGGGDADFYHLRHWRCLDAFVYFSHHLVTVPPPGWVNAAHTHGVPVLGTLITEWEAGAAHCRRLFGSREAAEAAAAALAAIAACRGFEGWLINIETGLEPECIPHLLHFLR